MLFTFSSETIGGVLVVSFFLTYPMVRSTLLVICDEGLRYEYNIDECPGGIQLRDVNHWFSKSRENTCICGEGSMLQFNGKTEQWEWDNNFYPDDFFPNVNPVISSWFDYNLQRTCEMIKGNDSSALFINAKKYENPANFPTRAIDILVGVFEEHRVAGRYKITFQSGYNLRSKVPIQHLLRSILINNQDPLLIHENPKDQYKEQVCAYNATKPEAVLSRYLTTTWGNQDLAENCEQKLYKPYKRQTYICPVNCETTTIYRESPPPQPGANKPLLQFRQILLSMAEVAMRLKYAEKFVTFQYEDHPYAAILQHSCRVFHRAFPKVIRWESLLNAVSLFGVVFEGIVPMKMDKDMFQQIKILLGRCTIQEGRHQNENSHILEDLCPAAVKAVELELNSSFATIRLNPGGNPSDDDSQPKMRISYGGSHNIVIELLWKMVQFVHARCLSSSESFPNVHHFYTNVMMELFSAPAVQLLWYQQGKYDFRQLGKAMIHIFPELPDYVLPTMEIILQKMTKQTHFNVLQRPKLSYLDERDMRCAGHGKLIWGGKACCYMKSEDKSFYFFNKVAFAKL